MKGQPGQKKKKTSEHSRFDYGGAEGKAASSDEG